nr:PREDICTED: uncharacterized protein LOC108952883 [Musa acuminata subsp. malaccensis]
MGFPCPDRAGIRRVYVCPGLVLSSSEGRSPPNVADHHDDETAAFVGAAESMALWNIMRCASGKLYVCGGRRSIAVPSARRSRFKIKPVTRPWESRTAATKGKVVTGGRGNWAPVSGFIRCMLDDSSTVINQP